MTTPPWRVWRATYRLHNIHMWVAASRDGVTITDTNWRRLIRRITK